MNLDQYTTFKGLKIMSYNIEQSVLEENKMSFAVTPILAHDSVNNTSETNNFLKTIYANPSMNAVESAKQVSDWKDQKLVDDVKAKMAQRNADHNWQNVSKTLTIREALNSGYGLKFYDADRPEYPQTYLILDQDGCEKLSMTEALTHPILSKIVYAAKPSFSRRNYRYHLLVQLSRPLQPGELKRIQAWFENKFKEYEYINDENKLCHLFGKESFKPEQYFNGTSETEKIVYLDESNVLDVDKMIAEVMLKDWQIRSGSNRTVSKDSSETTQTLDRQFPTITEEVYQYFYDEVLVKKFDSDYIHLVTDLIGYDDANIHYRSTETFFDDEELRFETHNSFNPKPYDLQGGHSLGVTCVRGQLPTFNDRTNSHSNKNGANFATFIDFYHACQLRNSEAYQNQFADARDESGKFKPGYFLKIVDDICDYYEIPHFESKVKSEDVINAALDSFEDGLVIIEGSANKKQVEIKVFDPQTLVYTATDNYSFATFQLARKIKSLYPGDFLQLINREHNKKDVDRPSDNQPRKEQKVNNLGNYLGRYVTDDNFYYRYPKVSQFSSVDHLIPIDDYVLDVLSKEISPNVGQAKNTAKPYVGLELSINDDDPIIQLHKDFWSNWLGCEIRGRTLLLWLILCVCRQAYTTRKVPVFIAKTKAGKSGYMQFIVKLMQQRDHKIDVATELTSFDFFENKDSFLSESLSKYNFIGVDEIAVKDPTLLAQKIKPEVQDTARNRLVNPKGKARYSTELKYALTLIFEQKMTVATDAGMDGRLVYFVLNQTHKNKANYDLLQQPESVDKILAWCLMQDVVAVKAEFLELIEHPIFKQALREKKQDADEVTDFVIHRVEFTHNAEDKVKLKDIFITFNSYYREKNGGECRELLFKNSKSFNKELKATLQNTDLFDVPLADHLLDREFGKNKEKHYFGIKLIEDYC